MLGLTAPTVAGVQVIGSSTSDQALNVHFEGDDVNDAWFAPDLVEFVDGAPGTQIVVGDRSFVRDASGGWIQQPGDT